MHHDSADSVNRARCRQLARTGAPPHRRANELAVWFELQNLARSDVRDKYPACGDLDRTTRTEQTVRAATVLGSYHGTRAVDAPQRSDKLCPKVDRSLCLNGCRSRKRAHEH